jgi:hypothetical protein
MGIHKYHFSVSDIYDTAYPKNEDMMIENLRELRNHNQKIFNRLPG